MEKKDHTPIIIGIIWAIIIGLIIAFGATGPDTGPNCADQPFSNGC